MVLPLDIVYELRGLKKKENGNSETYVKVSTSHAPVILIV
jgi:hypothetical protein